MALNIPITDEWLAACDFKWSQSERQPNKHWKLQLNTVREGSLAWESTTIEVQRNGWKGQNGDYIGDPKSWMLWITDTFNRTAFLGNIQWQKDIIDIAEIITRHPWNPETHIYGQAWPEGSRALTEKGSGVMSDKPILFSGPMVRAILEGRKTQTRRAIPMEMVQGANQNFTGWRAERVGRRDWQLIGGMRIGATFRVPYAPGDRLWVREAWRTSPAYDDLKPSDMSGDESIFYEADGTWESWGWGTIGCDPGGRKRQSMFMPRWASRLTLAVADVRVQRLQNISYSDTISEGIHSTEIWQRREKACIESNVECGSVSRDSFRELWDSLNAKRGFGWDANPWVCAVIFTAHRCNIHHFPKAMT